MNNKKIIILISIIFISIAGIFYCTSYQNNTEPVFTKQIEAENSDLEKNENNLKETQTPKKDIQGEKEIVPKKIFVHICGSIVNSGVYKMKENARIFDLIKKAGGFTKDAAKDYVNQAQLLMDGQKVYIPSKKELKEGAYQEIPSNENEKTEENIGLVNINQAGLEELMTLPGIGEAKAKSILDYREENGSFQSIEELKNISGIKDGVFNKISDRIQV